jgi:hypothetical protein
MLRAILLVRVIDSLFIVMIVKRNGGAGLKMDGATRTL